MKRHPVTARSTPGLRRLSGLLTLALLGVTATAQAVTLAPSDRQDINLGAQPWKYTKEAIVNPNDPVVYAPVPNGDAGAAVNFDDSKWLTVGLPHAANDFTTFINQESGGGQGSLDGEISWYRTKLADSASYRGKKVMVEFEGAHTGDRVYVNGRFIPGTGVLNQPGQPDAQATHVIGFLPHIVDLTPYLKFDGTDVLAVKVSRSGGGFFEDPGFSGSFRFGQAEAGIFRPVKLHVTNLVHIPENVYAGQNTWGTYVGTQAISADHTQAAVRVQTNVVNETDAPQTVTLTTQIVDADGNLVASDQRQGTLAPHVIPSDQTPVFDETLTVNHPTLWYPNNSLDGKPYLYKVLHTVSIDGTVVDAKQSTLGIRTITWDKDFPYINGKKQYMWGGSGRYDYPGLGSSVPEEQQWRDLKQMAAAGGNLWRPGHSPSSPEFVEAADALGVFIVQPSGDGENGFANACTAGDQACKDMWTIKREVHRDIVIRDRSHPSILAWEHDNGAMNTAFAQELRAMARSWDAIAPRAAADRTPNAANGDILSCSKAGCETYLHSTEYPNKPAWGAEYWGPGTLRHSYDYELAFALNYLVPYSQARKVGTFGMAQWYFADTPGETIELVEGLEDATHWVYQRNPDGSIATRADGTPIKGFRHNARGNNASMTDANRFPRMLYYIYESVWVPYDLRPVVKLAHTWNRSGDIQVNAFSNCPKVRLLVNGVQQGTDQVPNTWDTIDEASYNLENGDTDHLTGKIVGADKAQKTTKLPGQVHWNVTWQPGRAVAQCIDNLGNVRTDANGANVEDTLTTAGAAHHIELEVVNTADPIVKPDGTRFQITANGSDAAFIVARVVDANGVLVPDAAQKVDFEVDSGASLVSFNGGTQQYVDYSDGETPDPNGGIAEPHHYYHSPGSHELQFEGGLQKIALRTKFETGTVTVSASAPGLLTGHTSFTISAVPQAPTPSGPPSVIANPVDDSVTAGDAGHFSVTASGAQPLSFTWKKNGVEIPGANSASYTTPATTLADDGAKFSVVVHGQGPDQESAPAVLHVFAFKPVVISTQPQAQNVDEGQTAHFAVVASGSPKVQYKWMKDGVAIPNATGPAYDTPVLTQADSGKKYSVFISNSGSQQLSSEVLLTVNAARPPVFTGALGDVRANPGQPATFDVSTLVAGTAPFHYKWSHNGQPVGDDQPTFTISSVQQADVGTYSVTVTNITGDAPGVTASAKLTLAPPGANLARQKGTLASEVENPQGTAAWQAVDGNEATRWGSKIGDDNAFITVDLGSSRVFNRVVLKWENAHAAEYKIQYSDSPDSGFQDAYHAETGNGGTEDFTFDHPVKGRYVRMQGIKRATDYGYSLYEFEVYDSAGCCSATDRYTTASGSNRVTDTLSGLQWDRTQRGFTDQGAQFTQSVAIRECAKDGMRLPTVDEALAISGQNYSTAAFPGAWTTWTEGQDPSDPQFAFQVNSLGVKSREVAENNPGHVLCVLGTKAIAPAITAQPTSQKAGAGRSAHFAVTATGVGPLSYDWYTVSKNADNADVESFLSSTADGAYATPALVAADNGTRLRVKVVSAQGLSTTSNDFMLAVDNSTDGFDPVFGTVPVQQPGNGDNGGDNGGGNPPSPGTPGDGKGGVNIAIGAIASSSVDPERGDLSASAAIDGHFDTRWSSKPGVDPADLVVNFGSPKTFDHVIMRWENAYSAEYTIDVSEDGTHWNTVKGPIAGKGGVDAQSFPVQTAQYVRMNSTKRSTDYGNSLFEFEVYAAAATQPQQPVTDQPQETQPQQPDQTVPATGNLALHRTVLASDSENPVAFKPDNVNDGDAGTRWSSGFTDDQWIQVDLGSVQTIGKVVLSWENAHALAYRIDVSVDGKTWNVAYDNENGQGGVEAVTFPATSAQYVRMTGLKRSTAYGYSLWEMGVYAAGSNDGTTPPENPQANDPSQGFDYVTYPGFIGTQLRNTTNGKWRDDQIFVAVIGRDPASQVFSWVKPDGTLTAASEADNDGPGHLTKNGQNYPNYFFTLAQAKLLKLPKMDSGRIFVSVGEPMYIKILKAADGSIGFAGPNPLNATDPNIDVHYDWYEFTWNDNAIFINTTQVDQFSIPLSLDVYGGDKTRHESSGITQTRAQIFAQYNQEVPAEFQLTEADPIRILAPGKAAFDTGKPQEHYFDGYIDQSWAYYENHVLEMTIGNKQFEGTVIDGVLTFTHTNWADSHEPDEPQGMLFKVGKPSTQDVLEGKGTLARSNDPWGVEGQLEAQICAAFNRHVMEDTSLWKDPGSFYAQSPANYYSRFWHLHGVNGKAYGFAYDDVSDQSSTLIETQPEHLELGIGW